MFDLTLTFDNGPEPETTPFVLDVLARRSIRTTFFVVGHKLSTPEGRELARRAHEEGHWIGNHTWSHSVPLGLLKDPSAIGEEIRAAACIRSRRAMPSSSACRSSAAPFE
jgi:peptidoglycan/xylan/chitin deacetylase (PgdA/CDA1 family)